MSARRWERLAIGLVATLVIGNALRLRPRILGDGAEYFTVAEAFVRHGSPDLRPGDREAVARQLAADGALGAEHLAEIPEVRGRDGRLYSIHFWGYPLATLPVRYALVAAGLSALKSPQVTNAILYMAAVAMALFCAPWPTLPRWTYAALCLLSPALWFVVWPHPEVFSFSFTTLALVWRRRGRQGLAVLAAAVASVQNPPLALLAAAGWAEEVLACVRRREDGSRLGWVSAALVPAAVPAAFSLLRFGTPSLLTRGALDFGNVSLARALELLFDLNLGLLPYAPVVLGAFLAAAVVPNGPRSALGLTLAMAVLCSATCNWNSGTSGPARYAVWLYPIVLDGFVGFLSRAEPLTWR